MSDKRAWQVWYKALGSCGLTKESFLIKGEDFNADHLPDQNIVCLSWKSFQNMTFTKWNEKKRGYIYPFRGAHNIVGSFDPAYIGKGKMGLLQALIYDIKIGVHRVAPVIPHDKLTLYPTVSEFASWCSGVGQAEFLAVDIETPYSSGTMEDEDDPSFSIIRCSFGLPDGRAITFPWDGGYVDVATAVLLTDTPKLLWNADYDIPRLEFNSCPVNGLIIDAMWLFHFLYPDLPRSLASAGSFYTTLPEWKSLSSGNPELYSALDSHATVISYLGIRAHLQQLNMWETAWAHIVKLQVVLRKMHHRGLMISSHEDPLNPGALELFRIRLTEELEILQSKLDSQVPDSCKPTDTVKAKHLRGRCVCVHPAVGRNGKPLKRLISDTACAMCAGSGWNAEVIKVLPFNANSGDLVKDLMRHLGHPVPVSKGGNDDGSDKETTDKKNLENYARKYPDAPYALILQFRKVAKMKSTYTEWPMVRVSPTMCRVNTTILPLPQTGRLSSQNPNMQNIPKEGVLAEAFKRCIVARPGHILCKRDYSSIEGVLTAYFTGNPNAMKRALSGIHTYNTAKFLHIDFDESLPANELSKVLKSIKKDHHLDECAPGEDCSLYQRFKKANHMINYGAKARKLFHESPGVFKDLKDAKRIHSFIYNLDPALGKWHKSIENEVFGVPAKFTDDGYEKKAAYRVVTPYMYNRWFWDRNDLPKAIAMKPQSTAAAIIKEAMLLIDAIDAGEFMVLQVHDELVFDYPNGCKCHPDARPWEEMDRDVTDIMERSLTPLGGLVIRTERSEGLNYACH